MPSRRTVGARAPSYRGSATYAVTPEQLPIPDAGMIGAGNLDEIDNHARTEQSSHYSYTPVVATSQETADAAQVKLYGPRSRWGARNPLTLRPAVQPPQNEGFPAPTTSGPAGAPAWDQTTVDQHYGPTEPDMVTMGVAPQLTWWQRLFRRTPATMTDRSVGAVGETMGKHGPSRLPSVAAPGVNGFQPPDYRRTWDTPAAPGVPLGKDGQPSVAKAGVPLPDPEDASARETVRTGYTVENGWLGYNLPDMAVEPRVAAGPASPWQARPSVIPSGFYAFHRVYDGNEARHLSGQKGVMPSPTAGQPIHTTVEQVQSPGAVAGSFGGFQTASAAPGMTPVGVRPNTIRQVPSAWDYDFNIAPGEAPVSRSRRTLRRG